MRQLRGQTLVCVLLAALTTGCVTHARNYKPAGFNSADEARPYVAKHEYYASKLTPEQWHAFYQRFPEYWKDLEAARQLGSNMEYHPWYVAYGFRWTTLQDREDWPPDTVTRLDGGVVDVGDDIFQAVYAKGPANRLIWDNDFEILLFSDGTAIEMGRDGTVERISPCPNCWIVGRRTAGGRGGLKASSDGLSTSQVIKVLGLSRPKY